MDARDLESKAATAEKSHDWSRATTLFLTLAHHYKDLNDFENASRMFMRAATAGERCEDWRKIGQIWIQCASSVSRRKQGAVVDMVDEIDASKHYFPTLDIYAWERFSFHEQLGRAWRNAAYHLEECGSNQTAYVQYEKSGDAFYEGKLWAEASRSYYHGLISFIDRHGDLDLGMQARLDRSNEMLIREDRRKYLRRAQMYDRGLAARLISKGNVAAASILFWREAERTRSLAFLDRQIGRWFLYTLWKYSAGYGYSPGRWAAWVIALFCVLFPAMFRYTGTLQWMDVSRTPTWLDYVYFSLSTVTTGFDSSFGMSLYGKVIALAELVLGFVMLGFLLTLLSKKLVR
jgi:hypothetical protein